ncbi:glutaredoxin 3 [Jannaschia seohaensis]|uniref:Glutaredoxin n=1 Tax=Jannaschia seohaensis TaxID=475081 RepID=A0A2Y9A4N9_9RHOB|nr:glutaredoxin 3 [Jannaschia seohaensis]PWJ22140.1 glutaredoxin 3 [Jannaschia seohaensis]SSA38418.1 glutaredoxin 3 [Jannaschia seohaensis]
MKPVTIYTQPLCGFCTRALRLLSAKGAPVTEIDTARVKGSRAEMTQRANGRTSTPQIFIGDTHVGGCDDLFALEHTGKLDAMLQD